MGRGGHGVGRPAVSIPVLAKPARGNAHLRAHAKSQERFGSGLRQRRRDPHCRITPPALRHGAPWCLANTVIRRRALVRLKGSNPSLFCIEKCRSALGTERMLAPSHPLGPSILSAPNATDRQGEAAADGWCQQSERVSTRSKIDSAPRESRKQALGSDCASAKTSEAKSRQRRAKRSPDRDERSEVQTETRSEVQTETRSEVQTETSEAKSRASPSPLPPSVKSTKRASCWLQAPRRGGAAPTEHP
jgi:hypothetical protein